MLPGHDFLRVCEVVARQSAGSVGLREDMQKRGSNQRRHGYSHGQNESNVLPAGGDVGENKKCEQLDGRGGTGGYHCGFQGRKAKTLDNLARELSRSSVSLEWPLSRVLTWLAKVDGIVLPL